MPTVGRLGRHGVDRLAEVPELLRRALAVRRERLLDARRLCDGCRGDARRVGLGDEEPRLAVVEDERELARLRLRVDERERAARDEHAEDGGGALHRVVEIEADAVAALEAGILQHPRESQRVVAELGVGAPARTRRRSRSCRGRPRRRRTGCPGRGAPVTRPPRPGRPGTRPCRPRPRRDGSSAGASRGFATSRSWRIISDIEPASAISSVSLTGRPSANFATSRATPFSFEEPGLVHRPGLEQRPVAARPEEDVSDRRAIRDLRPRPDRLRKHARDGLPQRVLLLQPAQSQRVGQPGRELGQPVVDVREPALDRVGHQHPVALRVQEVALEEGRDLDVLRLRKRREACEARRKRSAQAVGELARRTRPAAGAPGSASAGSARCSSNRSRWL